MLSYLSVSTWSLHRLLGPMRWTQWDAENGIHRTNIQDQPQIHALLDLPQEAARRGYRAIEVCHFHFPSTDADYLEQLRKSFENAEISVDTLLLDYGDLTTEDEVRRIADMKLFREWIDIASSCGAKHIRLIAGEARPTDDLAIRRSAAALAELADYAATRNVRVITENFKELTSTGESCLKLLDLAGGNDAGRAAGEAAGTADGADTAVKMITDFGNFRGNAKYEELAMTAPFSVSVHAKAAYDENGLPDQAEFIRCLDAVKSTGYDGAFVLIYDGPGDMWDGLDRIKKIVEAYL